MRSMIIAAATVAAALLALTACASPAKSTAAPPAKPKISAAGACADFDSWYKSTGGKVANAAKLAPLLLATSEAPSGQLYQDLSTLESDVITASKATGSLGQAESTMTLEAAYAVAQDCQSVNPGS
jgi:hypothetical protein